MKSGLDSFCYYPEADADYGMTLQGNQGELHEMVRDSFLLHDKGSNTINVYCTDGEVLAEHGQIDERFIEARGTDKLKTLVEPYWKDLISIARITDTRTEPTGEIITEKHHLISSLPPDNPPRILHAAQMH